MKLSWALTALGLLLGYGRHEASTLRVRRFEVGIPNLPKGAEGLRVVQISDIHAGIYTSPAFLRHLVEAANDLKPDVVALTGDFISRPSSYAFYPFVRQHFPSLENEARVLARELASLRAQNGVWAVPGNHDGWGPSFSQLQRQLESSGVEFLVNRSTRLKCGLMLAGLDDLRVGNPNYAAALAEIAPEASHLVLTHNPRTALLLGGRNALVLSGHTHGGQVCLPGIGGMKKPVDMGRNVWSEGFYPVGRALLYVSPGVGTIAIPVRLLAPPEISLFVLQKAERIGAGAVSGAA